MSPPRLLVTGAPGIGKTTLVRAVVGRLAGLRVGGFYTAEQRGAHGRTGFRVVTFDGREGQLATTSPGHGPRVGRYVVQLQSFEVIALPSLDLRAGVDLYVIDEIGKMECLSPRFVEAVRRLLASDFPLLATIALRGSGFIQEVKRLPDVELIPLTHDNRERLPEEIARRFREYALSPRDQPSL
jgi:nucleoside-triphosphatase